VNFKVKVQVAGPPANIRPGFSVSGQIETDRRAAALAIPIPALVVADPASLVRSSGKKPAAAAASATPAATASSAPATGSAAGSAASASPASPADPKKKDVEGVFLVKKDGTVDFRKVKTGISADLQTEVVEGLTEGEEIVTGPFKALRSLKIGDRVKVDNAAPGPDAKKS
jgi:HlyD family secretion protein